MQFSERHRKYWRKNLRVPRLLLMMWSAATVGVIFFARNLDVYFFSWPFSFWVGAQGFVYLGIIWFYARYMNEIDQEHHIAEE